jgi:hypothetical protein
MSSRTFSPCSIDDLELTELSPTEWRVRDNRIPEDNAASLMGFVDKAGDRYEVMEFGERVQFHTFNTFIGAVSHFIAPPKPHLVAVPRTSAADAA